MPTLKRIVPVLLVAGVGLALGVYFSRRPQNPPPEDDPLPRLREQVAQEEQSMAAAFAAYSPKVAGQVDDLSVPAKALLDQLPGVAHVEVLVPTPKPTHRLIHVADWHFVARDLYAADLEAAAQRSLSPQEIDAAHERLLLEVELVQLQQVALLRCLVKHHGLRRVFIEGLTEKDLPGFRARVKSLKEKELMLPGLHHEKATIAAIINNTHEKGERHQAAKEILREIDGLLNQHRLEFLEMGAAVRLLISGDIEEVLPLDDAELLDAARPIGGKLDPDKVRARQDAQVRAALKQGPFALVVLGGAHDLSESLRNVPGGGCEYIRVLAQCYVKVRHRVEVSASNPSASEELIKTMGVDGEQKVPTPEAPPLSCNRWSCRITTFR